MLAFFAGAFLVVVVFFSAVFLVPAEALVLVTRPDLVLPSASEASLSAVEVVADALLGLLASVFSLFVALAFYMTVSFADMVDGAAGIHTGAAAFFGAAAFLGAAAFFVVPVVPVVAVVALVFCEHGQFKCA